MDAPGAEPSRAPEATPEPPRPGHLASADVARATLVVCGVLLALYLLWRLQELLFLLFLAILLATAIEPIVNRLRRGPFTRATGTLAVYTLVIAAIGLPVFLLAPSLVQQAGNATLTLPERIGVLQAYARELQPPVLADAAVDALDRLAQAVLSPAAPPSEQLVAVGETAAHTLVNVLTVFVLAFYWLVERASIKRAVLRLVRPERAKDVNAVWLEVEEKLGGWVRGQLLLMLVVGVAAGIGFVVLGLPNPILLAVLAGVLEMIPLLGPFLAFAPAVLVTLATDPGKAPLVFLFALAVQQIEGNVLVPRVMGHTVGVSPLTVLIGILAGSMLGGIPGAFLAVPVAGALQVILTYALHPEAAEAGQEQRHSDDPSAAATRPHSTRLN